MKLFTKKPSAIDYLNEMVGTAESSTDRRSIEQVWKESLLYYNGQQHFVREESGALRLIDPNRFDGQTYKANLIPSHIATNVATLQAANIEFRVGPNSQSRSDRQAARVAQLVFRHLRRTTKFKALQKENLEDAAVYGSGFLKVTWDRTAGPRLRIFVDKAGGVDLNALDDENLRREMLEKGQYQDSYQGDVKVETVSPFCLHWPPTVTRGGIDACPWLLQDHIMLKDEVRERYKISGSISNDDSHSAVLDFLRTMAFASSDYRMFGTVGVHDGKLKDKTVRVREYWERPNERNGMKGRMILAAGNTILRDTENPYASCEIPLPFVKTDWMSFKERFIGMSLVEQVHEAQRVMNKAGGNALEYMDKHSFGITYTPKGSGIAPAAFDQAALPGVVLEYNAIHGMPTHIPPPALPATIPMVRATALEDFKMIAAGTPGGTGSMPGQLRSGQAVSLMEAARNKVLTGVAENLGASTADVGTMLLKLVGRFWDRARVVRTVGRSGLYDVGYFTGADLRNHYQVEVFGDSVTLESADSFRAQLGDLISLGVLDPNNPRHKPAILKAWKFHTTDELTDDFQVHEDKAERILERLEVDPNFEVMVLPWEDHLTHAKVYERWLNSPDFDEASNELKTKIATLWQQHTAAYQQELQAQMQVQAQTRGAPSETGQASAPRRTET